MSDRTFDNCSDRLCDVDQMPEHVRDHKLVFGASDVVLMHISGGFLVALAADFNLIIICNYIIYFDGLREGVEA